MTCDWLPWNLAYPCHPCMVYLPTWMVDVSKYTVHGCYGVDTSQQLPCSKREIHVPRPIIFGKKHIKLCGCKNNTSGWNTHKGTHIKTQTIFARPGFNTSLYINRVASAISNQGFPSKHLRTMDTQNPKSLLFLMYTHFELFNLEIMKVANQSGQP